MQSMRVRRDTADAGDEAVMLARRTGLPVVVGKDRMEGIRKGVADFGIDVAIFDDGAQVRNVHKDVQMHRARRRRACCLAAPFPLGVLREPLEMAKKADIILVNKGELDGRVKELMADIPTFHVRYRPLHLCRLKRPRDGRLPVYAGQKGARIFRAWRQQLVFRLSSGDRGGRGRDA